MIVLDASVLIGYLDGNDAHHAAAGTLLSAAIDDDLGVNPLTLAEVLVGPARTGRLDLARGVLRQLDIEELPFPPGTPARLAELRASTGLKMPDCCVLLSAAAASAGVSSFDARLLDAAERLGIPTVSASAR